MTETARVLGEAGLDKVIVLTGAMLPYAFKNSDALFNLGGSLVRYSCYPHVYIVLNGQVFAWDNVIKDRERGVFRERLPQPQ